MPREWLSHSSCLTCVVCEGYYHLQCVPNVCKDDDLYLNRNALKWFCKECIDLPYNHIDDDDEFLYALAADSVITPCPS